MQGLLDYWFRERQIRLARTRRIRIDDRTLTPGPSPKKNVDVGGEEIESAVVPATACPSSPATVAPPPPSPSQPPSPPPTAPIITTTTTIEASSVFSDSGSNDCQVPMPRKGRQLAMHIHVAKRSCEAALEEYDDRAPDLPATACPSFTTTVAPPPPPSHPTTPPPSLC